MTNFNVHTDAEVKPGEPVLDWPTRKRVALGTARGLEYLHEHCNPKIIHRDVKAANVLLDEDFEAVVGDFGLAKLVDVRITSVTTQVRGTMGHIAPEYLSTGKSSERTDVFGYGIMLLELVTGQPAVDFSRLEGEDDILLLDHVRTLLNYNLGSSFVQFFPRFKMSLLAKFRRYRLSGNFSLIFLEIFLKFHDISTIFLEFFNISADFS